MSAVLHPAVLGSAAHELGHAIVSKAGGLKLKSITVDRRTAAGLCLPKKIDWDNPRQLRAWLIACVAGFEAEDRWRRENGLGRADRAKSRTDFSNFHYHAPAIGLTERAARAKARSHLGWHWGRLQRLVPRLAEHGHISL